MQSRKFVVRTCSVLLLVLVATNFMGGQARAFIYKPQKGAMWDPSVLWHDGKYHAFMMYNKDGENGLEAKHCLLATSTDGVHWRDEGAILEERERAAGASFFKCMVARCGDRFILNHGVARRQGQDTLRFYESTDLHKWQYLFSNNPDSRWYGQPPQPSRWDHMYILPKAEGNPSAGYWGHVVSIPKPSTPSSVGMMESADGRAWTVLPPAPIEWPTGMSPTDYFEYGGCERIGGKYYLIGGRGDFVGNKGYSMFTLVADNPRGPFRPDVDAFRLSGSSHENVAWLAVWCRGNGELLVSNYASMTPGDLSPWMLPLRKPIVDKDGHLRLAWWKGNEALKGEPLPLANRAVTVTTASKPGDYAVTYLDESFDPKQGLILEGTIRARVADGKNGVRPGAGFVLQEGPSEAMAIMLGVGPPQGRETHIGRLIAAADGTKQLKMLDVTGKGCATITGIEDGKKHPFRLLSRLGLFELYVDSMLVQTYYYKPGSGRVGFVVRGVETVFSELNAWRMSDAARNPGLNCTASDVVRASDDGTRTFKADKRYLLFPCSRGLLGKNKVFINVDGKPYMSAYDALIAPSHPDHWRCIDLKLMQGKTLSVKIEGPDAAGIALVKTSDTIPGKVPVYQEPGRPKVHFSPMRGWLNDPSGMIYFEDTWHLYYANTRFNNVMAGPNNAWGHATSKDLLHWEEQPIFLTPVRDECSFWTGGSAVDVENTTGLGKPGKPAIVHSANNGSDAPNAFTQCLFVSTDGGMTARRDPEMMYKPLPKEASRRGGGTRDPMILWYAPEKKWVMVVYNQPPGGKNGFYFFESKDLKNWTEMSVLEDMFECPNLFQLPVDGNQANMRWVTWGSSTEYLIGKFNGRAFVPDDNRRLRTHFGAMSASQVFANAPGGRIVQIGWAHCCDYDTEFSQMATFPMELSLRTTQDGVRLYANFVPELAKMRNPGSQQKDVILKAGAPIKLGDVSEPTEIIAEFEIGNASKVSFTGSELNVRWNAQSQELEVHGEKIKLNPKNGRIKLHILLDIPSVEVVGGDGESYMIKGRDYRKLGEKSPLAISVDGGDVKFSRLEVYSLQSIH